MNKRTGVGLIPYIICASLITLIVWICFFINDYDIPMYLYYFGVLLITPCMFIMVIIVSIINPDDVMAVVHYAYPEIYYLITVFLFYVLFCKIFIETLIWLGIKKS